MPELNFSFNDRMATFWRAFNVRAFFSKQFLLYGLGWFFTLYLIFALVRLHPGVIVLAVGVNLYLFWKLLQTFRDQICVPTELLLLLFLLVFSVQLIYLNSPLAKSSLWNPRLPAPLGTSLPLVQVLLLAGLVLFFSILIMENSRGRTRSLLVFAILGVLGHFVLSTGGTYSLLFFQALLFVAVLGKTAWLEELTRIECLIFWGVTFLLFQGVSFFKPVLETTGTDSLLNVLTFTLPFFLYLLFKMYLLAILVKIPVVLVYNHARLSRKLRISSFFQSTFPQVVHLAMLLVILYLFTSVWQAENLREAFVSQMRSLKPDAESSSSSMFAVPADSVNSGLSQMGYELLANPNALPQQGMLALSSAQSDTLAALASGGYFYFNRVNRDSVVAVQFIKVDSVLLSHISENLPILAGTRLLGHPHSLNQWEDFLFNRELLQEETALRIFPFGLLPPTPRYTVSAEIAPTGDARRFETGSLIQSAAMGGKYDFIVGRMLIPLFNTAAQPVGHFALDILLKPSLAVLNSVLFRYTVFFVAVYLLLNLFVIRRAVSFGSKINRKVVQKFEQLKSGIREVSSGNLDYKVSVEGADEFVELATHFNQMGEQLKKTIEQMREKERLEQELTIARQVQLSLLPSHLPKVQGFQVAATLKTATEVGGDFYDLIPVRDNKFLFTIGDVSGKSTSAAFYMAQCVSLIRYSPRFYG